MNWQLNGEQVYNKLKGKLILIALYEWSDSISGNHESKVMMSKTSERIYNELLIVSSDIISNNQKLPVRCCAHQLSLMSDAIKKPTMGQLALFMIDSFVQRGDLQRYSITEIVKLNDASILDLEIKTADFSI